MDVKLVPTMVQGDAELGRMWPSCAALEEIGWAAIPVLLKFVAVDGFQLGFEEDYAIDGLTDGTWRIEASGQVHHRRVTVSGSLLAGGTIDLQMPAR